MQELKRFHYHHADGVALGGRIEQPFEELIPVQSSLSLPAVGGHAAIRSERFQYREFISYKAAHTQVSGNAVTKNGPWKTLVTTSIEGLNVLNVITADRVVARISSEHPAEGYHPKISFVGTQFENLRVAGCRVTPQLDLDMCRQVDDLTSEGHPKKACIRDQAFLDRVNRQRRVFISESERREEERSRNEQSRKERKTEDQDLGTKISDYIFRHAHDYADNRQQESGQVLCSLVNEITVDESQRTCPGRRVGHIFEIPDVGKMYLAELAVTHGEFQLIMLRFELGCPVVGTTSFVTARINGVTGP
jgi:hypothetical protein